MRIFPARSDLGTYVGSSLVNDYYAQRLPNLGLRIRMVDGEAESEYQSYGADDVFTSAQRNQDLTFVEQLIAGQLLARIAQL